MLRLPARCAAPIDGPVGVGSLLLRLWESPEIGGSTWFDERLTTYDSHPTRPRAHRYLLQS
jgi:hypothetical protein